MPLFINSTAIESLYINGTERKSLKINDIPVFGKRYHLTRGETKGVNVSLSRFSSPNQGARTGYISEYEPIYYGDVIYFYGNTERGYSYPKFYIKNGKSGRSYQTFPYRATVVDDIAYDARADYTIKTSGNKEFQELYGKGTPQISYRAIFEHVVIDSEKVAKPEYIELRGENVPLPYDILDCGGNISISCEGNRLIFTFQKCSALGKGFETICTPKELILTEVKRV
ncbi:MAG: hypothetical protein K2K12_06055 [Clostridia bacterium]|nr:hypothetical protein [Clostridia bacterium]